MAKRKETVKKINLELQRDTIITTANVVPQDSSIITSSNDKPSFLNIQQVRAIGPNVGGNIKIGDWLYIDLSQYMTWVTKEPSEIVAGVGGRKEQVEELRAPIWAAPGDEEMYFKITEREIEGRIIDFDALPAYMKKYETIEEFVTKQQTLREEIKKEANKIDFSPGKLSAVSQTKKNGPAIKAGGVYRK